LFGLFGFKAALFDSVQPSYGGVAETC
jgi:hypothetical protein